MVDFRRNASKIAEETAYSSDNENDGYLSESDDGNGDERDESFPEEGVEHFSAGLPTNFLEVKILVFWSIPNKGSTWSSTQLQHNYPPKTP